jgi:signal transduction histidine kinase
MIGAAVAVAIGFGYQALYREAAERGRLIDELMNTREELASTSRDAGKLAERERLAAEIHDTVAQGLSSIQMLLHAAERADPNSPAVRQISLARETAADSLAETRQLIAELTPAALDGQSLSDALGRICERASSAHLEARSVVEGEPIALPMPLEATLVRIAQGAVANVLRHAHATRMAVTLTYSTDTVSLDIVDNGAGFDVSVLDHGPAESFGLNAIRRRVQLQGGTFDIESEPGHTAVTVTFPLEIGDE